MTLLEGRAGGNELPEAEAGHPVRTASIQLPRDIVSRLERAALPTTAALTRLRTSRHLLLC
jgi:hypothetical protein